MPIKDGLETTTELKQRWPTLKIIAMSGGPGRATITDLGDDLLYVAKEFGADISLQKPFELTKLVSTVKNLLSV